MAKVVGRSSTAAVMVMVKVVVIVSTFEEAAVKRILLLEAT